MKKETKPWNAVLRFLIGVGGGALSALPGFQSDDYAETFSLTKRKEKGLLSTFLRQSLYALGFLVGFLLFFLVPVQELVTGYSFAITCLVLALFLSFAAYDVYRLALAKDKKKHLLPSALLFLVLFSVPFLLHFFPIDWAAQTQTMFLVLVFLLAAFSSFLSFFAGISPGSCFLVTAAYLPLSERLFGIVRLNFEGQAMFLAVLVIGFFLGWILHLPLQNRTLEMERHSTNLGFSLAMMATIFAFSFEPTLEMGATTSVAASFFILMGLILGGIGVGLAFTAHGYRALSPIEKEEKAVLRKEATPQEARRVLGAHYRALLLEGLLVPAMKVDQTKVFHPMERTGSEGEKSEENEGGIDLSRLKALEEEMKGR